MASRNATSSPRFTRISSNRMKVWRNNAKGARCARGARSTIRRYPGCPNAAIGISRRDGLAGGMDGDGNPLGTRRRNEPSGRKTFPNAI